MRRAFTLVELLVVIGVVAVLIALLLPAAQQVRHRSNRLECVNRLKQIALALHGHVETEHAFPPAHTVPSTSFGCPKPYDTKYYYSWMTRILPYLEQSALYRQIDWNQHPWWQHPINETVLDVFRCNADSRSSPYKSKYATNYWFGVRYDEVAFTGYMGVSGTSQIAFDGMLYANSKVTPKSILDGAGNTLLVGERPPSDDLIYGWWFAGSGDDPFFGATDVVLGANEVKNPWSTPPQRDVFRQGSIVDPTQEHRWHFWSLHHAGSNFAFADGSVRFLGYDIGQATLNALATRAGGETFTLPSSW